MCGGNDEVAQEGTGREEIEREREEKRREEKRSKGFYKVKKWRAGVKMEIMRIGIG